MDEYERLEDDLQKLYDDYMAKFRNQAYMEQMLDEFNKAEMDKTEVQLCFSIQHFMCKPSMSNLLREIWS